MSISSDDSRDRPEPKARVDAAGTDVAPDIWDEYDRPPDDPLTGAAEPLTDREMLDRERWLRGYIDREQRFRLYFAKYIAGLLDHPSRAMRVWRWLIDDFRSERREQAVYLNGGTEMGLLPWFRRRMARRR